MCTLTLIKILERKNIEIESPMLKPLMELASKNKVLLEMLRVLNIDNPLRKTQEKTIRGIAENVKVVSKILSDLNFTFFRFIKPVSYVPSDIDILISPKDFPEAIKRLKGLGYRVFIKEPYCVELLQASSPSIDLYTNPTVSNVIYIDGQALLEHTTYAEFHGTEIKTLESYAECVVTASHAIYKEHIYTLNDFFVVEEWTTKRSFKLANELNCLPSLKLAIVLNENIKRGFLETPYKLPYPLLCRLMASKFLNDKLTRVTSLNIFKKMRDPRIGKLILTRLLRSTY